MDSHLLLSQKEKEFVFDILTSEVGAIVILFVRKKSD